MSSTSTITKALSISKPSKVEDQYVNSIEQEILSLSIVQELRNDSSYRESRGFDSPDEKLTHNFTYGALRGTGKLAIRPFIFFSEEKKENVFIVHVGSNLCGHNGIAHGGLLSTMMDEALATTVIPSLPDKNGATAYLHVNFRKPCKVDQVVIIRCKTTKLERRKGYVEGTMETVEGVRVVDADALFISVKKLEVDNN